MKTWFNGDSEGKIKRGTSNRKGTLSDELSKADHIGRQLRYNEPGSNQFQEQEQKIQEVNQPITKVEVEKNQQEEDEAKFRRKSVQMSAPFPPRRQGIEAADEIVEEPKPIQMSAPFPPRRQAAEEIAKKVEKPEGSPFGVAPFPARIQPGVAAKENTTWKLQTVKTEQRSLEAEIPSPFSPNTYDAPKPVQNLDLGSISSLGEMQNHSYSDNYSEDYDDKFEESYNEPYVSSYEEEKHNELGFKENTFSDATSQAGPIQDNNRPTASKPSISLKSNITISFDKDHTMDLNMNIGSVITILNSSGEKFDFKITNDGEGGQNLNIIAPSHTIYQILALFE